MAMNDGNEPLARAAQALREDDSPGWVEVSQSVMGRVRTLVTPAATLRAFAPDGSAEHGPRGSTLGVSGRILVPRLRAVIDSPSRAADSIDLTVTDDRCSAVHIALICAYGTDLQAEGAEVRAAVVDTLRTLLGPDRDFDAGHDIVIEVVDVVDGDPRHQ